MPPLQEELVVCPRCESRIKLLVLADDPGYVIGRAPNGDPMLIPVQGSSKEKLEMPEEKKARDFGSTSQARKNERS